MILFRYLTKEVLVNMFAVSLTLLVIVMSGRFVKYLAQAASGDLAPNVVFSVILYRMPGFLELVLPLGLFIGILLAYGRLYVESEMTVMSACGLSTKRLALFTLAPSVLVAALVGFLSLYAGPLGVYKTQQVFEDADNSSGLELLVAGRFRLDEKAGRVTYIERLDNDSNTMYGVFSAAQSEGKEGRQLSILIAEQGVIETREEVASRYLVFENGYQYMGAPGKLDFRVTEFERFGQLIKEPERQRSSYKKSDARTTEQLLASDRLQDKATLQWRISLIILVPIIALIAQALSKTNHRKGRYVKMLPAFLIYIFYLVGLNAARDAIEKEQLPLEVGMWWVHAIFFVLALFLLFSQDVYRQFRHSNSKPGANA